MKRINGLVRVFGWFSSGSSRFGGESGLTNLYSVSDRAFQKHSNRVKATPGQQYSSRGHTSRSWSSDRVELATLVLTFLINSVVMGLLLRSIAPSATIMIFSLFIPARFYREGGWWRKKKA